MNNKYSANLFSVQCEHHIRVRVNEEYNLVKTEPGFLFLPPLINRNFFSWIEIMERMGRGLRGIFYPQTRTSLELVTFFFLHNRISRPTQLLTFPTLNPSSERRGTSNNRNSGTRKQENRIFA